MSEKPILFSAPMVRAILAGQKRQTRRILKPQPYLSRSNPPMFSDTAPGDIFVCPDMFPATERRGLVLVECESLGTYHCMGQRQFAEKHCPYGQPGDRLWVRETARVLQVMPDLFEERKAEMIRVRYEADGTETNWLPWPDRLTGTPQEGRCLSYGCYREASRITLEITSVRAERLQEISEEDAQAEGAHHWADTQKKIDAWCRSTRALDATAGVASHRGAFRALWESIHGPGSWDANPWVWVVSFSRAEGGAG